MTIKRSATSEPDLWARVTTYPKAARGTCCTHRIQEWTVNERVEYGRFRVCMFLSSVDPHIDDRDRIVFTDSRCSAGGGASRFVEPLFENGESTPEFPPRSLTPRPARLLLGFSIVAGTLSPGWSEAPVISAKESER